MGNDARDIPIRDQLAQFNAWRAGVLGRERPRPGERWPLERSGTGGDVEGDDNE